MKSRVKAMVEELASEHQRELAAAGTLVDLEELTCHIGDEFARQLCESELVNRSRQAAAVEQCECPECGALCPRGQRLHPTCFLLAASPIPPDWGQCLRPGPIT